MTENKPPVSAGLEPLQTDGVEAPWVELRGQRILLVEDEEALRIYLRTMLELDGHQVTEASNGVEALHSFTTNQFDLVITDFEMPAMKGDMLAFGIKLLAPSLPILMITGSTRARLDAENPVDVLLDKPFTVTDLHRALKQLWSTRREPAQMAVVAR